MTAAELARRLGARRVGRDWRTSCPLHDDRDPSLDFRDGDKGGIVYACRSRKCDSGEIHRHFRERYPDLFGSRSDDRPAPRRPRETRYRICDAAGVLVAVHVRQDFSYGSPKRFSWERPDGTRGLNGIPTAELPLYGSEHLAQLRPDAGVIVCEGEKATDAVRSLGLPAVGTVTGASGCPGPVPLGVLRGRRVIPWLDADEPGQEHMDRVARALSGIASELRLLTWGKPGSKDDAADFVAAGGTREQLIELATTAPTWTPTAEPSEPAKNSASTGSSLAVTVTDNPAPAGDQYPDPLAAAAYHGPLGELVRVIEPHTEADPVAILLQALVMFGNVIGRGPYFVAEADNHYSNLFACMVGITSKSRKGTSYGRVAAIFCGVEPDWLINARKSGLSSGEGLIHAVRDPAEAGDDDDAPRKRDRDPGVADKRLMLVETEFASVLRVLAREGNTLSAVIRQSWDTGTLNTLTKHSPTRATGAHVSLIGHITADELRRYLNRTEAGNGFANRILWACVRRSRLLPFGGQLRDEDLAPVRDRLAASVRFAREQRDARIAFDDAAAELWEQEYPELSEGKSGMLGAVTSRAEAQTVRLALLYALADCSHEIRRPHLEAALALWRYCEDSARFVFGHALGDPLADELLRLLRQAGAEGMDREAMQDALGRHQRSSEIGHALALLAERGLARSSRRETGGRPEERWQALAPAARYARKAPAPTVAGGDTSLSSQTPTGPLAAGPTRRRPPADDEEIIP